jgi:hypothetical protein
LKTDNKLKKQQYLAHTKPKLIMSSQVIDTFEDGTPVKNFKDMTQQEIDDRFRSIQNAWYVERNKPYREQMANCEYCGDDVKNGHKTNHKLSKLHKQNVLELKRRNRVWSRNKKTFKWNDFYCFFVKMDSVQKRTSMSRWMRSEKLLLNLSKKTKKIKN